MNIPSLILYLIGYLNPL